MRSAHSRLALLALLAALAACKEEQQTSIEPRSVRCSRS
jgi:predicted small lipoprotein YifL